MIFKIFKAALRSVVPFKAYRLMRAIAFRHELLPGPFSYQEDGFATIDKSVDFLSDDRFKRAYTLGKATGSWVRSSEIQWRAYICCWAASQAKNLEGDFVECGVNRGGYSRAIIHYIGMEKLNKKFFLLDTFQGIPAEQISAGEKEVGISAHTYQDCYQEVIETFKSFNFVKIIRGKVPETLMQVDASKIAYLSIDMNVAEPEIAAARFFWDRLVAGAVIVLDDYNFTWCKVQRAAFNQFARERKVEVLALPTGQGLIFKP